MHSFICSSIIIYFPELRIIERKGTGLSFPQKFWETVCQLSAYLESSKTQNCVLCFANSG